MKKYKYISSDFIQRVIDFLDENPFTNKDNKTFDDELKRLLTIGENTIKIVLDIIPEATPRPRLSIKSGTFYVKNSKSNNEFLRAIVLENRDILHIVNTQCSFIVNNFFPIPSDFSKVSTLIAELGLIRPITKPDWDNLGKTYSDMIQKWIIADDSLIVDGESHKYYSLKPRVEIIIKYKLDFDCNHNKRLIIKRSTNKK